MITEKYETKTYTKTERVLVSEKRFCDVCGKEITGPYWDIVTGHFDWGNDSCESRKNTDACSVECLLSEFKKYTERSAKRSNTEYIEIEHEMWNGVKGDITYDQT